MGAFVQELVDQEIFLVDLYRETLEAPVFAGSSTTAEPDTAATGG